LVELWLKYGKTEVFVEIPPETQCFVAEPSRPTEVENVEAEVESAIEGYGYSDLERLIRSSKKVSLLVDTQLDDESFLRVYRKLTEIVVQNKSKETSFKVLLSPWRYRKVEVKRFKNLEGLEAADINVAVVDRYSESQEWVVDEASGLQVHHEYLSSDLKLVLSPTEYHGVYGLLDCRHATIMGVVYAKSRPKRTKGLEGLWEIATGLHPSLAFQTVHSVRKGLVKVFVGRPEHVVNFASSSAHSALRVGLRNKADIVIASPGGMPYDSTLMSTLQTLGNVEHAIKNDGILILAGECAEGLGGPDFAAELNVYAGKKEEYRPPSVINHEAMVLNKFRLLCGKHRVALVSTLPKAYVEKLLGAKAFDTLSDALSYALRIKGKECSLALVPDAARVSVSWEGEGDERQGKDS